MTPVVQIEKKRGRPSQKDKEKKEMKEEDGEGKEKKKRKSKKKEEETKQETKIGQNMSNMMYNPMLGMGISPSPAKETS